MQILDVKSNIRLLREKSTIGKGMKGKKTGGRLRRYLSDCMQTVLRTLTVFLAALGRVLPAD